MTEQLTGVPTATVSERAVLQRVNRRLAHHGETLRSHRSWQYRIAPYYHVDLYFNAMLGEHVDLEDFARNLGALADHEAVVYS
jgi:hypothetical protein